MARIVNGEGGGGGGAIKHFRFLINTGQSPEKGKRDMKVNFISTNWTYEALLGRGEVCIAGW